MHLRQLLINAYYSRKGIPALATYREFTMRERWDRAKLASWCEAALQMALNQASTQVEFYREHGCTGDLSSFPVIQKRDLQDNFERLKADGPEELGSWICDTSGSTGQRVHVLVDMRERISRFGCTWRGDFWGGFSPGERYIKLWGVSPKGGKQRQALVNSVNKLVSNQTMLGTLQMDGCRIREIHAYLRREHPRIVSGFTSSLREFSHSIAALGLAPIECGKVIATAENLDPGAEEAIRSAFHAPIMQRYGCREAGDIAHQCEKGQWHIHSDHVHLEVLKPNGEISSSGSGSLLITKLSNRRMPLVRYAVADHVTLDAEGCECGRSLPVMQSLTGRDMAMLRLPSGRLASGHLGGLPPWHRPIRQWQLERTGADTATYRYVPLPGFEPSIEADMLADLERLFSHELRFTMQKCESIPPAAGGKHMQVISLLDAQAPTAAMSEPKPRLPH